MSSESPESEVSGSLHGVASDAGSSSESGFLHEPGAGAAGRRRWPAIEEMFESPGLIPEGMDALWSQGWRHFGTRFFRYSLAIHEGAVAKVIPLRIDLSLWTPSKSQTRVARRNQDLEVRYERPQLDPEHQHLFERHTQRFKSNIPENLETFLGSDPGRRWGSWAYPCECVEVVVRRAGVLVAASYLDVGREGVSSVYACFDPEESARSLGTATFLWEIAYAQRRGCRYLYPGYVYDVASPYDYKKRLGALEAFDWTLWRPFQPTAS